MFSAEHATKAQRQTQRLCIPRKNGSTKPIFPAISVSTMENYIASKLQICSFWPLKTTNVQFLPTQNYKCAVLGAQKTTNLQF